MDWTQRLRIRQLHVLVALYETRNVSHTAERLSMTQPALSRWLAELESELGVSLFERHSRGLVPTRFCAALVVHARTILSEIARTQDTIRVMADGAAGQLAIGATPTVAVDLLPDAICRFREAFPHAHLSLAEGTVEDMLPALREGRLDFVVGRTEVHGIDAPLRCDLLYAETIRVIAGPNHPLARRRKLKWEETRPYTWIGPPANSQIRRELDYELALAGEPAPTVRIESATVLANVALLQHGELLAVMSGRMTAYFHALGQVVPLPLPYRREGTVGVLRHRNAEQTPMRQAFMAALTEAAR
ncbi:LysR family transcriptional regulator [Cupriavidus taiwanensis]|uniref:LysR family transcriptional regulator n=1 Tax=Cupriavidus taiwanensis TaxID=164546 RepID=UPI000E19C83C|nr:LysR family transcriptional regulator [Cupriavidus taiwanensis]SPA30308.1 LysR family transcriptional regulator [Cupriavidus taiwanensis]